MCWALGFCAFEGILANMRLLQLSNNFSASNFGPSEGTSPACILQYRETVRAWSRGGCVDRERVRVGIRSGSGRESFENGDSRYG